MPDTPHKKSGFFTRMKERWGVKSNLDIVLILVVFSLAGTSILKVDSLLMNLADITSANHPTLRIILHIILFPFIYQLLLLFWAFIFGQFEFFWNREKKIVRFLMKKIFRYGP